MEVFKYIFYIGVCVIVLRFLYIALDTLSNTYKNDNEDGDYE